MTEARLQVACERCGKPMVLRTNRESGEEFLGCSGYPRCKATQLVPAYVHMQRAGAQPLPGLEGL